MKVQIGEAYIEEKEGTLIIFPNKTYKYLLPCLKEYGTEFMSRFNSIFKVAAGIGDMITENCGVVYKNHIFLQLETKYAFSHFVQFLEWIREQPMYENDYVFDNIQTSTYHMVVLKFPDIHLESYSKFKSGSYSQMFTKDVIDRLFKNYPETQHIFFKDSYYKIKFVEKVNDLYDTNVTPKEFVAELDFSPKRREEIFNHNLKT